MSKPLARRAFLKVAALAPAGFRQIAERVAKGEAAAALATSGARVGPPQSVALPYHIMSDPRVPALIQSGLLPEWLREEIEDNFQAYTGNLISPDVASLRSVSLGAKLRMQSRRTVKRGWDNILGHYARARARELFTQQAAAGIPELNGPVQTQ